MADRLGMTVAEAIGADTNPSIAARAAEALGVDAEALERITLGRLRAGQLCALCDALEVSADVLVYGE